MRKKIAKIFLAFVVVLSVGLAITGLITQLNESLILESFSGELGEAFRVASHAYPMSVRIFSIILNSVGGTILIVGAAYSFLRDRRRTYNLLIIIGSILPMIGGSAIAFFNNPNVFFEFELGGTIFLFLGFLFSDRFIRAREMKMDSKKL